MWDKLFVRFAWRSLEVRASRETMSFSVAFAAPLRRETTELDASFSRCKFLISGNIVSQFKVLGFQCFCASPRYI